MSPNVAFKKMHGGFIHWISLLSRAQRAEEIRVREAAPIEVDNEEFKPEPIRPGDLSGLTDQNHVDPIEAFRRIMKAPNGPLSSGEVTPRGLQINTAVCLEKIILQQKIFLRSRQAFVEHLIADKEKYAAADWEKMHQKALAERCHAESRLRNSTADLAWICELLNPTIDKIEDETASEEE